jgi:hypothetical protein
MSAGNITEISAKQRIISSKCFPITPRHELTRDGGFDFSGDIPAIEANHCQIPTPNYHQPCLDPNSVIHSQNPILTELEKRKIVESEAYVTKIHKLKQESYSLVHDHDSYSNRDS